MHVNSVMPKEKFLVWLHTFSNVSKFSDAKRENPGVTTRSSDVRWIFPSVTSVMPED